MKKNGNPISIIVVVFVMAIVSLMGSCKRRAEEKIAFESVMQKPVDFHVQEVVAECGLPMKILEIKEVMCGAKQIFFWVLLKERTDALKVEAVARSIIGETIAHKQETYRVFTIHFFEEVGYRGRLDQSYEFVKASFLPEGSRDKIGRVPIDHYRNYKFLLEFQ